MGWQAGDSSSPGEVPGQEDCLPELLAGFAHGGKWEAVPPSAVLAATLEAAAGPEALYEGADTDALVGIVKQWAAIESWAAAGMLAALRAMMLEDGDGQPQRRRRGAGWDAGHATARRGRAPRRRHCPPGEGEARRGNLRATRRRRGRASRSA